MQSRREGNFPRDFPGPPGYHRVHSPHMRAKPHGTAQAFALALLTLTAAGAAPGEDLAPFLPRPVEASHFEALTAQSPFTRTLNLSDSLILTGVARLDGRQVATLLDKDSKETYVVSGRANSQGWKMVELKEDEDLEKVAARISVDGGEVVTVRYAEWQLDPGEARPAGGRSEEGAAESGGDRRRTRGPPPEIREKMSRLSDEQRSQLFRKVREMHEKNPDMSWDDRRKMFREEMDKMIERDR